MARLATFQALGCRFSTLDDLSTLGLPCRWPFPRPFLDLPSPLPSGLLGPWEDGEEDGIDEVSVRATTG